MQLTKEQAVQEHRKMWNWIANQYEHKTDILEQYYSIESIKEYYITQYFPKEKIECDCFCCEYDRRYGSFCNACPIEWSSKLNLNKCFDKSSTELNLYGKLYHMTCAFSCKSDSQELARIARQIANLPERKW